MRGSSCTVIVQMEGMDHSKIINKIVTAKKRVAGRCHSKEEGCGEKRT
jgi:hypothetical protein